MIRKIKKFPQFLKEVKMELKKVNWSSKEELFAATIMVIIVTTILTLYIFGVDSVFTKLMEYFLR
ncbi:MAG: preprotein translocase subunit SecE [Candidatus Omnitrophica bacterium 4484_70.2]|nr:MAG: preprotein translocase subunit SecE [Candidatus Omnitrophica bacterium 4484_70.2]